MPSPQIQEDGPNFDAMMHELATEAGRKVVSMAPEAKPAAASLAEIIRPLVQSIAALGRATAANAESLARLETQAGHQEVAAGMLSTIQSGLDEKRAVNSKLFDAMHEEMKGYKDAFLFEALQKPTVRDLIMLFDDLSAVHQQMQQFFQQQTTRDDLDESGRTILGQVQKMGTHVDHAAHTVIEIMSRLEVEKLPPTCGKHDKQLQRAVLVEPAERAEQDGDIVRSVRPAFAWRGRTVRPEEVIIRKFRCTSADPA